LLTFLDRHSSLRTMPFRATPAQLRCPHTSQNTLGSNGDQRRITCTECKKVLFIWFHRQANKSLMCRHLAPDWVWVEDTISSDRSIGAVKDAAFRPNPSQEASATIPAGSGESPERCDEPKDEWTIVPNRCEEGCDCDYCAEESRYGQESY